MFVVKKTKKVVLESSSEEKILNSKKGQSFVAYPHNGHNTNTSQASISTKFDYSSPRVQESKSKMS